MTAASIGLNVLLRERYLAYALSIGTGVGLVYLYSQGYNHWLYNPVLYNLWTNSDLTGPASRRILVQRIYCLVLLALFLVAAHLGLQRNSKGAGDRSQESGVRSQELVVSSLWSVEKWTRGTPLVLLISQMSCEFVVRKFSSTRTTNSHELTRNCA